MTLPTLATSLESTWNFIYSLITIRVWESNLAFTSNKISNPTWQYWAYSQMLLSSPMLYSYLSKPLLRAIYYGVEIVVTWESKTWHLLLVIYANILGRLLFIWFWLAKGVWGQIYGWKPLSKLRTRKVWWEQCGTQKQYSNKKVVRNPTARQLWWVRRQGVYVYFCFMISFNRIADLGIDFELNYGL